MYFSTQVHGDPVNHPCNIYLVIQVLIKQFQHSGWHGVQTGYAMLLSGRAIQQHMLHITRAATPHWAKAMAIWYSTVKSRLVVSRDWGLQEPESDPRPKHVVWHMRHVMQYMPLAL